MPTTTVKQNFQVTIPTAIREAVDIRVGETLEARAENGHVVLIPQREARHSPQVNLAAYIGTMKGVYGETAEAIESYLDKEREAWH